MATASAPFLGLGLIDLRELRGRDLEAVLRAQVERWRDDFLWDFSGSAAIVRRSLDARELNGYALRSGGETVGYCYFIQEDDKALIGDAFILDEHRDARAERLLLERTLGDAALLPGVRRVEGQLLTLAGDPSAEDLFGRRPTYLPRLLMARAALDGPLAPPRPTPGTRYSIWAGRWLYPAADLVAESYVDHVDRQVNDQYESVRGARGFLINTTRQPGCGRFEPSASIVARDAASPALVGICLCARVRENVGHITQLCVSPRRRRQGVAAELLRRSLAALPTLGCDTATLTVTESNQGAVKLYESLGFRARRRFPAVVWGKD